MKPHPTIVLSAFADEAANHKTALEQMTALAALGLRSYTPRFVDVTGEGTVEHVVDLSPEKRQRLQAWHDEYGMSVTSIGSRIGKVKLQDQDDGTQNRYVPFDEYLGTEVAKTIAAACDLGTRLIRGFSFYHPRGEDPQRYIEPAAEQIGRIADAFGEKGIVYGLEVESNLIGQNGRLLAELAAAIGRANLVLIFDGGNLSHQGYSPLECVEEFNAMLPYLGWMHVKDYRLTRAKTPGEHVDEESDWNFVPANLGDSGHELVFRELATRLPEVRARLEAVGVPEFFVELEPHLKGGGQFGGFSGPDGMGVAVRSVCSLLDYVGIDYDLRSFDDIRAARGF